MKSFARGLWTDLYPQDSKAFDNIPDEKHWLLALLRMGMDLYVVAGREENVLVRKELESWAKELSVATSEFLRRLEQCSRERQLQSSDLPNLLESKGIIIATALVELALKDANLDPRELAYLEGLFGKENRLSLWKPAYHQHWLMGEFGEEVYFLLDSLLEEQVKEDAFARRLTDYLLQVSKQHRLKLKDARLLEQKMATVRRALHELRIDGLHLGTDFVRCLDEANKEVEQLDHLRLAVIGEFKRGKSTLINALLRRPGFMPTDELPCTSAITEIHAGHEPRFVKVDLETGHKEEQTEEEFRAQTSDADERGRKHALGTQKEGSTESIPRWIVHIPSPFFDNSTSRYTLIDTPGLNESTLRDELAKREARTAHAAVLVLSASQLLSQHEQGLVDELGDHKVRGLIVAINFADRVKRERWDDFVKRVMDILGPKGLSRKQIVCCSARYAEEAFKAQRTDEWTKQFELFEERIQDIILENATPIRVTMLGKILDAKRSEVMHSVQKHQAIFEKDAKELSLLVERLDLTREKCQLEIDQCQELLKKGGKGLAEQISRDFTNDWEGLLDELREKRASWSTEKNPLSSPKQAATEMAGQAEKDLVSLIKNWVQNKFKNDIDPQFQSALEDVKGKMSNVADYLEKTKGLSADESMDLLLKQATTLAFGEDERSLALENAGTSGAIASVVTAVVSLVIGYIVADVILYYMLSLISGFFNPVLLAAAVVVGIAAYLLGGKEVVKSWIQGKIADKIVSHLAAPETCKKIATGIEQKAGEVYEQFANAFASESKSYVDEARLQWEQMLQRSKKSKEEQDAFLQSAGLFLSKFEQIKISHQYGE